MCGITGIYGPVTASSDDVASSMLATLVHRGPDGHGIVSRGACSLGLQRLAIVGLDAPGRPFSSEDGAVTSVCNGEIYNSRELRAELEAKGHRFATGVDTEVILHLWEELGPALVDRLQGMFAFAVWDSRRDTLLLGRDRAGEKPLFYWQGDWQGESLLVFGSELRALLAHPAIPAHLEPRALVRYLAHGYCPAPLSPIAGIRKLPPGHLLVSRAGQTELVRYWDLAEYFGPPGGADRRKEADLADELDSKLAQAVRRRSHSDVPFGVFLSGGLDSSMVLAHLSALYGPGVPAFTLGHTDLAFDESRFAVDTARHFDAELHRLVVTRADLEEGLATIGRDMDEPLGDASTIPTYLLSRFARERVKVVLSGEGADELFGGYPTYLGHGWADRFERLPGPARRALIAATRKLLPVSMGNVALDYLFERFVAGLGRPPLDRHNIWFGSLEPWRLAEVLSPTLAAELDPVDLAVPYAASRPSRPLPDALAEFLYADFTNYLPDDLLTKIDRASMLASLEARSAFLDHELAEFVAGIPSRHKVRGRETKSILRRVGERRLPKAVLERRKRGFNIPFSRWILEGLGDDLRRRFSRERVAARGLFSYQGIEALLAEHMARRADHRKPLYGLLAFDLWCDRTFGDGAPVPWQSDAGSSREIFESSAPGTVVG